MSGNKIHCLETSLRQWVTGSQRFDITYPPHLQRRKYRSTSTESRFQAPAALQLWSSLFLDVTQRNIQEQRRLQERNPQLRRCQTWSLKSCMFTQSKDHRRVQNNPPVKTTFNQLNPAPTYTPQIIKDQFYMIHLRLSIQAVSVRRGAN